MILPRPALARGEVVLEVRVATARLDDPRERLLRQRRAAEIRVDDDARRVENATQPRLPRISQLVPQPRREVTRIRPRPDLLPRPLDHRACRVHRERVASLACELVHRGQIAKVHLLRVPLREPLEHRLERDLRLVGHRQ